MPAPHILHLHSTFDLGGKEWRAVRLMNAWGAKARHTVVSAMPERTNAMAAIAKGVPVEIAQDPPPLTGKPSVGRYEAIARYMRRFDLVLTYNWGAIDGVMAARVFGRGGPPVIHHEDGFNEDEAARLKPERNVYRRIALPAARALVVPSAVLEGIARNTWKQPAERVHRIANGIDTALYAQPPKAGAIPGFRRKEGETVVGVVAGLRAVKNLPLLVRALGGVAAPVRLVIAGDGPERATIAQAAAAMGLADRVHFAGFLSEPHKWVGLFDIVALSSLSEQFPVSVVEAMAAGLPVVSTPVGDVIEMVAEPNRPYIVPAHDEVMLRNAIEDLARNPDRRAAIGQANRERARALYDERAMVAAYASLYASAMNRPGVLG
jgi:glycosyltransferase involved in cell wall biosynthesis